MAARQALVRLEETGLKKFRKDIFLAVVFMISLPVFAWLRWNPVPWLDANLEAHGLARYVQVEKVEKSGLGLRLNKLRIQIHQGPDIILDSLKASLAWFRIIKGVPALHVQGTTGNATFDLNVSIQDGALDLNDLDIHAQSSMIRDFLPRAAMLNLTGNILMTGNMELRQADGLPLAGVVVLQWKKAASGLLGQEPLGDFRIKLASLKQNEWRWEIQGGKSLSINGGGHLSTMAKNPALWKIDGAIHIQTQGRAASLLFGMAGHSRGTLVLSGALAQPRLEFSKP